MKSEKRKGTPSYAGAVQLNEQVRRYEGELSSADHAVLDVLMSHPAEASFLTATNVATRANVHVAATTRLAQKLGFRGYPELRASLQGDLLAGVGAADRVRNSLTGTHLDDIIAGLAHDEARSLLEAAHAVDHTVLRDAARRMLAARRIFLYANGNATALTAMLERRLRRFGFAVTVLGTCRRDIAEGLVSLTRHDALVAIALRRPSWALAPIFETANDIGAHRILITDTVHTRISTPIDAVLAAPRGESLGYQSLSVPMMVANALILTIAELGGDRIMHSLERLDQLLTTFSD